MKKGIIKGLLIGAGVTLATGAALISKGKIKLGKECDCLEECKETCECECHEKENECDCTDECDETCECGCHEIKEETTKKVEDKIEKGLEKAESIIETSKVKLESFFVKIDPELELICDENNKVVDVKIKGKGAKATMKKYKELIGKEYKDAVEKAKEIADEISKKTKEITTEVKEEIKEEIEEIKDDFKEVKEDIQEELKEVKEDVEKELKEVKKEVKEKISK